MSHEHNMVMAASAESEQHNSGTRTACDLLLRDVQALGERWEDQLEPGDLVLFRATDNWLSRLIATLDGYWSHSAIYIGDGAIVHAAIGGISAVPLEKMQASYPNGVGVARPERSAEVRGRAASWARNVAGSGPDENATQYSGRDLGLAFAVLLKARLRGAKQLPPVGPDDLDLEGSLEGLRGEPAFESTCSGFAYRCYSEGTDQALTIQPAPGISVEDGKLHFPEEPSLYGGMLDPDADHGPDSGPEAAGLEALALPDWTAWKDRALMLAEAAAASVSVLVGSDGVELEEGVSPADLWCSPDISNRWFLLPQHVAAAQTATEDCP